MKRFILLSLLIAPALLHAADAGNAAQKAVGKEIARQLIAAPKPTINGTAVVGREKQRRARRDNQREQDGQMRNAIADGLEEYYNCR